MTRAVTVATYNVHGCVGRDRRYDPQRTLAVIRELQADVIALQEFESRFENGVELLERFSTELSLTAVAGPTMRRQNAHYGNAVLTHLPILTYERVDLSFPGREPRGALDIMLDAGRSQPLQVVATHLGLSAGERRAQAKQLIKRLHLGHDAGAVLMGDVNEWFLWGRPLRWLRTHFKGSHAPATYPARLPLLALDRIWVHPRSSLRSLAPHRTQLSRVASDHLPLRATLSL